MVQGSGLCLRCSDEARVQVSLGDADIAAARSTTACHPERDVRQNGIKGGSFIPFRLALRCMAYPRCRVGFSLRFGVFRSFPNFRSPPSDALTRNATFRMCVLAISAAKSFIRHVLELFEPGERRCGSESSRMCRFGQVGCFWARKVRFRANSERSVWPTALRCVAKKLGYAFDWPLLFSQMTKGMDTFRGFCHSCCCDRSLQAIAVAWLSGVVRHSLLCALLRQRAGRLLRQSRGRYVHAIARLRERMKGRSPA